MDENSLNADAALPGITKCPGDDPPRRIREVRFRLDDDGGVVSQFQHHGFLAGVRFHFETYLRRAGEGEELDAVIGDERFGDVAVAGEDAPATFREGAFHENLAEEEGGERRAL